MNYKDAGVDIEAGRSFVDHIKDTVNVCYEAWIKNECRHYYISHKKRHTILSVAKLFGKKI